MSIKFKCSCGRELDVPEETAGREAFCPGCRKTVPVPRSPALAETAPSDEREASEFRPGALANLLDGSPSSAAPAPAKEEPAPERKAPDSPDSADAPAKAPPAGVEIFPDRIKFHCECGQKVAVRLPPPQTAGKCPRCKRSLAVPTMPGVTDRRPPADAREKPRTTASELRRCTKCGRRIEDPAAAFCPRCGFPLSQLPPAAEEPPGPAPDSESPPRAEPPLRPGPGPGPAAPDHDLRRRSAREAADLAADRLRPVARMEVPVPAAMPSGPSPAMSSGGLAGPARRLGSFLLDVLAAAGVGLGGYVIAGTAGLEAACLPAAAASSAAFLVVNNVIFAGLSGARSLGMIVSGTVVLGFDGRPAGMPLLLVRLLAELILAWGSPLALFDSQRRTLHDLVCGTSVRDLPAF